MKPCDLPSDIDERLWEWAWFFRDHKFRERCRSIESRFQATSKDFAEEGWGDTEAAPQSRPERLYSLRRALQTHDAIQQLDRMYKWTLTYGYCYPAMPRFVVLRAIKRFTGRRLTWNAFLDTLDIGRMRVYATISRHI